MLEARSDRWRSRVAGWAKRRQGPDAHAVTLKRRRIFILPTGYGVVFGCTVAAMLLGALNYNASLGFVLAFLLTGLGLMLMQHCHNNLLGLTVRFAGADPVFAGTEATFRITLQNGATVARFDIEAQCAGSHDGPIDLAPGVSGQLHLPVPTKRRGWLTLERFSVSTRHPGNLFRAWTWIHMEARCLVYPALAAPGKPFPVAAESAGSRAVQNRADDDFVGLRDAVPGDSPRRLAWKAFARSDQLLVKEFAGGQERPCLFDWEQLDGLDAESRLSQLARWCVDAARIGQAFGLNLPDRRIPLGSGERHLHECLQVLALHGATE